MPALEKTFLEQPYCSKELLKDAKEVIYAEVQSSSSQRVPLAGSPLPTHMRDGCWAHPCPGSPPIPTAGQGSLNCHKLTKSGFFFFKSASNLCTPRGHWLGCASQLGGSQPQPVSWFIQPVKSTPMLNPEGASFALSWSQQLCTANSVSSCEALSWCNFPESKRGKEESRWDIINQIRS